MAKVDVEGRRKVPADGALFEPTVTKESSNCPCRRFDETANDDDVFGGNAQYASCVLAPAVMMLKYILLELWSS